MIGADGITDILTDIAAPANEMLATSNESEELSRFGGDLTESLDEEVSIQEPEQIESGATENFPEEARLDETLREEDFEPREMTTPAEQLFEPSANLQQPIRPENQIAAEAQPGQSFSAEDLEAIPDEESESGNKHEVYPEHYFEIIQKTPDDSLYSTYLKLRPSVAQKAPFYLNLSDEFLKRKQPAQALRILSNLAELELENHELLRILGYRLMELGEIQLAISVFEQVLKIREEEPHSYRDLALAYAANHQYQPAVELLYKVVTRKWDDRFPNIALSALHEMNALIASSDQPLDLAGIDKKFIKNLPLDIRVVLDWFSDNTDFDLWISDPNNEKCYYSHQQTKIGGLLSPDFTGGYGPEVFMLKNAANGTYTVSVHYYSSWQQTLPAETVFQVTLFTHFGHSDQQKKTVFLRLDQIKDNVTIGHIKINQGKPEIVIDVRKTEPVVDIDIEIPMPDIVERQQQQTIPVVLHEVGLAPVSGLGNEHELSAEKISKIIKWMETHRTNFSELIKDFMSWAPGNLTSDLKVRFNGKSYHLFLLCKKALPQLNILLLDFEQEKHLFIKAIDMLGRTVIIMKGNFLAQSGSNDVAIFDGRQQQANTEEARRIQQIFWQWYQTNVDTTAND